jgi:ABC-type microcin C transport system duplicated ATPase subunit YejF
LSTVRLADQILVLHRGQIVERGNHEQLLELEGIYAKLCKSGLFFAKEAAELEHTALLEGNLYLSNPLKSARLE